MSSKCIFSFISIMGFLIIIGNINGEGNVGHFIDWSNTISLSYKKASDLYDYGNTEFRELWRIMRKGDVYGADSVIIPVTPYVESLIIDTPFFPAYMSAKQKGCALFIQSA